MKKILLLFIFLGLLVSFNLNASPNSYIINDFEEAIIEPDSQSNVGFQTSSTKEVVCMLDTSIVKNGQKSLKIAFDFTDQQTPSVDIFKKVNQEDGKPSSLSNGCIKLADGITHIGMWVYGDNSRVVLRGILKYGFNSDGSGIGSSINFNYTDSVDFIGWKYLEYELTSQDRAKIKDSALYIYQYIRVVALGSSSRTKGCLYFDDVQTRQSGPKVTILTDLNNLDGDNFTIEASILDTEDISVEVLIDGLKKTFELNKENDMYTLKYQNEEPFSKGSYELIIKVTNLSNQTTTINEIFTIISKDYEISFENKIYYVGIKSDFEFYLTKTENIKSISLDLELDYNNNNYQNIIKSYNINLKDYQFEFFIYEFFPELDSSIKLTNINLILIDDTVLNLENVLIELDVKYKFRLEFDSFVRGFDSVIMIYQDDLIVNSGVIIYTINEIKNSVVVTNGQGIVNGLENFTYLDKIKFYFELDNVRSQIYEEVILENEVVNNIIIENYNCIVGSDNFISYSVYNTLNEKINLSLTFHLDTQIEGIILNNNIISIDRSFAYLVEFKIYTIIDNKRVDFIMITIFDEYPNDVIIATEFNNIQYNSTTSLIAFVVNYENQLLEGLVEVKLDKEYQNIKIIDSELIIKQVISIEIVLIFNYQHIEKRITIFVEGNHDIEKVIEMIDDSVSNKKIRKEAKALYESLSEEEKAVVTNYYLLESNNSTIYIITIVILVFGVIGFIMIRLKWRKR